MRINPRNYDVCADCSGRMQEMRWWAGQAGQASARPGKGHRGGLEPTDTGRRPVRWRRAAELSQAVEMTVETGTTGNRLTWGR